jgi:Na+-driven multidrug efflux pump
VPPALPLRKPFLIFLAPMMLSNILQPLFGTINNVIEGVWMAYPITFCTMFLLQMSFYLLVWRKRAIQRLI